MRNATPRHHPRTPCVQAAGLTAIELVIAITVLAILIALSIPAIGHFRESARDAQSISNLRQHAGVFASYTASHDDQWPLLIPPSQETIDLGGPEPRHYFEQFWLWHVFMARDDYDTNSWNQVFFDPRSNETGHTDYHYSQAFVADPLFWNPSTRLDRAQRRSTRVSEVRHPAAKSLLLHQPLDQELEQVHPQAGPIYRMTPSPWVFMAAADGSAQRTHAWRIARGYFSPNGVIPRENTDIRLTFVGQAAPGTWTLDGVRGRDLADR
ncbi:MAG: type II secretion system protein [Phycisphaerales bacterium]|nr:MAG: type II secretion system protein [Phycisphaerales bacterium]